jgi:hypothetical protein
MANVFLLFRKERTMTQMQHLPERAGWSAVSVEEAYASLEVYNLEINRTEEALTAGNDEAAFSHLLLAVNCASNILDWGAMRKFSLGFAKRVTETAISSIMQDIGGGEPPYDRDRLIQLLEQWLESSWAAKLTGLAGRVAAALGAESYQIQAGFPGGVSIAIVFPAVKSDSARK